MAAQDAPTALVANARKAAKDSALFQVSNWVFLAGSGSYQDLLADTSGTPSPLEHFWSLSIEEQFYWMWPIVMLVLLRRASTRRSRITWLGALTAITTVCSQAANVRRCGRAPSSCGASSTKLMS